MLGKGKHPIEHLRPALQIAPMLVAHVNDATDEGIEILAETQTSVAYCPRASRYFHAANHFGPHRYQDMLDAGINVCLGTDSIVNLDTPHRMSTLDEMRLLWHESRPDPTQLLAMGTINGAKAIGLAPDRFRLNAGATPAGVIAVEVSDGCPVGRVWTDVMRSKSAPTWVYRGS
jgi:cytosine/adenosine deaminase-related metal-dependent hydrolase